MDQTAFMTALDQAGETLFRVAWALLHNGEDCRDAVNVMASRVILKRGSRRITPSWTGTGPAGGGQGYSSHRTPADRALLPALTTKKQGRPLIGSVPVH